MAFSRLPRWRLWIGGLISAFSSALAPRLASAHALTGSGGWTDELVCAVPTVIMLVLVFILGRPTKKTNEKPRKPAP